MLGASINKVHRVNVQLGLLSLYFYCIVFCP